MEVARQVVPMGQEWSGYVDDFISILHLGIVMESYISSLNPCFTTSVKVLQCKWGAACPMSAMLLLLHESCAMEGPASKKGIWNQGWINNLQAPAALRMQCSLRPQTFLILIFLHLIDCSQLWLFFCAPSFACMDGSPLSANAGFEHKPLSKKNVNTYAWCTSLHPNLDAHVLLRLFCEFTMCNMCFFLLHWFGKMLCEFGLDSFWHF